MPTPMSFNQSVIEEFRANNGKVGGPFAGGELLLLTTPTATPGTERTVPLGCFRPEGLMVVVASNLGSPEHPAWYRNLLAHPVVRVEVGTEVFAATAAPAEGARRDRLFEHVARVAPGYRDYQSRTARALPVVVLERYGSRSGEGPREVANLADRVLQAHTWLRAQLRHVRAEAEAHFAARASRPGPGATPLPALGLQIRQHCLAFCDGLRHHHTGEDEHIFPALARNHPELRAVLDRLGEEHRSVARIRGELLALLVGVDAADPRRFAAELDRMSGELMAHLDREEAWLLPVLARIPFPPTASAPAP